MFTAHHIKTREDIGGPAPFSITYKECPKFESLLKERLTF